jgi:hypothetical protein
VALCGSSNLDTLIDLVKMPTSRRLQLRSYSLSIAALVAAYMSSGPAYGLDCNVYKLIAAQSENGFEARRQAARDPVGLQIANWKGEELEGNKCVVKEFEDRFTYGCYTDDGPSQAWEDMAADEVGTAMTCFGSTPKNLRMNLDEEDDEFIIKEMTLTISKEFGIEWSVSKGRADDATSYLYVTFTGVKKL